MEDQSPEQCGVTECGAHSTTAPILKAPDPVSQPLTKTQRVPWLDIVRILHLMLGLVSCSQFVIDIFPLILPSTHGSDSLYLS